MIATWLHNFWGLHFASFDFLRSPPECRELILGGTDLRVCLEQHKWRWPIFRNQSYEWSISRISLYPHNYIQSSFTTKNVIRQQCFCLLTDGLINIKCIWVNKIFENIEKKIYEIFGPKYSIVRPICLNDGPLLLKDRPNYLKHRPNYYQSSPQIPTEMAPFTARGLTAQ